VTTGEGAQTNRGTVSDFHARPPADAASILQTDPVRGVSPDEAARRLAATGPNELEEKPRPGFLALLFDQLKDFLVIILIAAAIISIVLGEWVDAGAIILIVILNAVIGVVQESKAEEALAALKRMAAPDARVVRDGQTLVVPTRELVPGDLVILESGNHVPADLRLTETVNLKAQEASLTGESVPVGKKADARLPADAVLGDRCTMVWAGTTVTFGRGRGIVTATGMSTQIGLIAAMLQEGGDEDTPLQKKLRGLGKWLGLVALVICAMVFLVGIIKGQSVLTMFLTAVSLAIAAVPEGLPAIVTICLALGMQEMVKRHALIRKLPAVETLGSATVICTDKTGTLTQNRMTVTEVWDGGGLRAEEGPARLLLQVAMLASDAQREPINPPGTSATNPPGTSADAAAAEGLGRGELAPDRFRLTGDPTEGALVDAAARAGLHRANVERHFPRVAELPFDSERKLMSTIHQVSLSPSEEAVPICGDSAYVICTKGAPDVLLARCTRRETRGRIEDLTPAGRNEILAVNAGLASQALRVLGVACRPLAELPAEPARGDAETGLTFLGLIGMIDPARPEAAQAIGLARRAGLKVVMVTGDYKDTAAAIGRTIGLIEEGPEAASPVSGSEIDALDDEGLADALERATVFARVSPQHKVRIVEALKARGHVVGMTGDGVNDAPALKRADIGIAMGISGTDVTRETADMVLTDDNFASIISAVEQGRVIYSNIRKFVSFLLSCNLGEIGTIFIGTLLGWPVPLTAVQLLWMNLLTDGAPALALGLEKGEPGTMDRPPRPTREPIINRPMILGLVLQSVTITCVALLAFWLGRNTFGSVDAARTMAFVVLSGCQILRAYTNRSEHASLFSLGIFSNRSMQYATASSVVLLLAVVYIPGLNGVFNAVPLSLREWGYLAPLLFLPAIVDELTKLGRRIVERTRR
jgi:Ca2+-transporting ATPase